MSVIVGASVDPAGVTMVDSIKVYTKTKEAFCWPEESDEFQEATAPKTPSATSNVPPATTAAVITTNNTETAEVQPTEPLPLTSADRLLGSALEVLDGAFAVVSVDEKDPTWQKALNTATSLLTLPTPPTVQQHTRALLASLFPTRAAYYNHKDQAELTYVMQTLSKENKDMDVEAYQRLLVTARSVAVSSLLASLTELDSKEKSHFVTQLMEAFWKLHISKPANPMLAPVCLTR
ncbi:hypothetical protein KUTeg_021694 [Tegillarca granosa]|uniref:Vitellogenin n=1 Tax=Tegillarca granosa TaxID=220873 RepID=A0ABQ9E9L6_TEGGR|nr:hypothetical protein KUTeg_021694 [Tegillarca granosa]